MRLDNLLLILEKEPKFREFNHMEGSLKTLGLEPLPHPSRCQAQGQDYPGKIREGTSCLMEGILEAYIGDHVVFEDVEPAETGPTCTGRERGRTK